ncbi:MAG: ATP-binding protein [Ilumatobacteraceae bacterium]
MFCDGGVACAAEARHRIAELASSYHPERIVRDAQLVASELVTNALEHGALGGVILDTTVTTEGVTLCITSHGASERLPDPDDWTLPPASALTGRGLAVTRRLADPVRVAKVPGAVDDRDLISITAHVT